MRYLWIIVLLCYMGVSSYAEEPFQQLPFTAACETAKKENKWIIIDFYTTWCGPCKMLDKNTWSNAEVKSWLKDNTINLKIDAEAEVELAKTYKVHAYPTILILKSDGTVLDRLVGYREPKDFLKSVTNLKLGKDSLATIKESLVEDKANDPMLRIKYGRELVIRGQYKEALTEYLWCFDNGNKYSAGFAGVRLSFLLSDIERLSEDLPEALAELKTRRNNAAQRIVSGDTNFSEVMDLTSLNRVLKDDKNDLEVFDQVVAKGNKAFCTKMVGEIMNQLIEAHRYQDIIDHLGNLMEQLQIKFKNYQGLEKYEAEHNSPYKAQSLESYKNFTVREGAKFFATLLGVKRDEEATKMADVLIRFNNKGTTYIALVAYALKVDNRPVAQFFLERGTKTLPDPDKNSLKEFADKAFADKNFLESLPD